MKKRTFLFFTLILIILFSCDKSLNNNLAENNPREIYHAMGKTIVSQNPSRVVTLTNEATEAALILDVQPIGAVISKSQFTWYPHIANQMTGVLTVGTEDNVNIADIKALKPDLILGSKMMHEDIYDELAAIAPTIFTESVSGYIRDNFDLYSEALHKDNFANQVIVNYNNHIERARMGLSNLHNKQIVFIGFFEERAYLFLKSSFIGNILSEARIQLYEYNKQSNNQAYIEINQTDFIDIANNAQILFYFTDDDSTNLKETWFLDPMISNLTGTIEHVYEVDENIFFHANGIIAAKYVLLTLEDIETRGKQ